MGTTLCARRPVNSLLGSVQAKPPELGKKLTKACFTNDDTVQGIAQIESRQVVIAEVRTPLAGKFLVGL